jgi:phosphoglycerol transferase MdoB-like AlkP superfamily enzyme
MKRFLKIKTAIAKYKNNIAFFAIILLLVNFETYLYYGNIGFSVFARKSFSQSQFLYTLACSLVVMLPYFIFKEKKGTVLASVSIYTLYLLTNSMYYRTYDTVMPIWAFGQTENLNGLLGSILYSFRFADFYVIIPLLFLTVLYYKYLKRGMIPASRTVRMSSAAAIVLFAVLFTGFDMEREHKTSGNYLNKIETLYFDQCLGTSYFSPLGCLLWQINDYIKHDTKIKLEEEHEVAAWLHAQKDGLGYPVSNIIPGKKNLIIIIVESLESWPVGCKVNNNEITPCLSRLIKTNNTVFAPYVAPQTKGGRSSDTQLMINTGLLPVKDGAVFFRFPANKYFSLAQALKEKNNYTTALFIGQDPSFWNQGAMNHAMGFEKFFSSQNFNMSDIEGLGLSDESFFRQSSSFISKMHEPFFLQLITLSSHTPFKLSSKRVGISLPKEMPWQLADYIRCVNYTDKCIGSFMESLKKEKIFDNSTIVIVGDHEALPKDQRQMLAKNKYSCSFINGDEFVPMIIVNSPFNMTYDKVLGQTDIYPTLLDVLGLTGYKWKGLGSSIFKKDKEPFAVNARLNIIGNAAGLSAEDIKSAKKAWDISNIIITKNYFSKVKFN